MWAIAPQKVNCLTSRLSAAWFTHLVWHRLLWFTEYCDYEGLVDVRGVLNVTRKVDHNRNVLAIGPASAASNVANRQSLCMSCNAICIVVCTFHEGFATSICSNSRDIERIYAKRNWWKRRKMFLQKDDQ